MSCISDTINFAEIVEGFSGTESDRYATCGAGRVSVWKLLQSCHALRNEMAHLCGQLQAYLMFEVLERAWVELTERLASVTHLDDLIGRLCRLRRFTSQSKILALTAWHAEQLLSTERISSVRAEQTQPERLKALRDPDIVADEAADSRLQSLL